MSKKIATSLDLSSNRIQNLGIGSEASDAVNKSQLDLKVTANSNITAGTNTKITYDSKGLVTSGTNLSASDIPNININQVNTLQTVLDSKLDNISLIGEYTQLKPVFGSGQTSKLTASASNSSTAQGWTKLYSWPPAAYNKRHLMLHATSGGRGTITGVVSVSFMQEATATTISAANITSEHIAGTVSNFSLIYNTTSSMIELWYNDIFTSNQQTVFSPIKISGTTPTAYYGVSQANLPAYSTKFNSIDLHVDYLEGLTGNVQDQIDDCFNDDPFDIQPTTDLNSIVNSGSYRIFSSVAFSATYNQPVGAYTYGQLRVFVGRVGQVYQEYHPDRSVNTNERTVYRRNKYSASNAWTGWVRDVTTDDLDAKQPLDPTLTALAGLTSGIPLLTSDSEATSINRATLVESLRANSVISGGGALTVSSDYQVRWSDRFIIISNGKGSHFSTFGHFDIRVPSIGYVISGIGCPDRAVTTEGVKLDGWEALYYEIPVGMDYVSREANFRVIHYGVDLEIPETWVMIALRNTDKGAVQFPNGVCLYAGESKTEEWQKQLNKIASSRDYWLKSNSGHFGGVELSENSYKNNYKGISIAGTFPGNHRTTFMVGDKEGVSASGLYCDTLTKWLILASGNELITGFTPPISANGDQIPTTAWVKDVAQPLDDTLTALAGLSSGIPLLTSDSTATTINRATLAESLRANSVISGGGTLTVSSDYQVRWSDRFIVIDNGKGSHFSTDGHFDIRVPSIGYVISGIGCPDRAVTADGIKLNEWEALYYELPIGMNYVSRDANFKVIHYAVGLEIPETWVMIAMYNRDINAVQFPNGVCLYAGESKSEEWQKQINNKAPKLVDYPAVIGLYGAQTPMTYALIRFVWADRTGPDYDETVIELAVRGSNDVSKMGIMQIHIAVSYVNGSFCWTAQELWASPELTGRARINSYHYEGNYYLYAALYLTDSTSFAGARIVSSTSKQTVYNHDYYTNLLPLDNLYVVASARDYWLKSNSGHFGGVELSENSYKNNYKGLSIAGTLPGNHRTTFMVGDKEGATYSGLYCDTLTKWLILASGNELITGFTPPTNADDGQIPTTAWVRAVAAPINATLTNESGQDVLPTGTYAITTLLQWFRNNLSQLFSAVAGKAPTNHASSSTTYGISNANAFGHGRASSSTPTMNGTGNAGTDNGYYAREGHVHPSDTSRLTIGSGLSSGTQIIKREWSSSNTYANGYIYLEY